MNYNIHYVYRITNIKTGYHYSGSRSTNLSPLDDIGVVYFSSSSNKLWIQDQKDNPQDYIYKIIFTTYKCRMLATAFEVKYHNRLNVRHHSRFINKSNQASSGFDATGRKMTKLHKKKISNALKGVKHNKERVQKNKDNHADFSGSKNPSSITVNIYNNKHVLMYTSVGNLERLCLLHSLPYHRIIKSYKSKTNLYDVNSKNITRLTNNGNIKYDGWYAVKVVR